MTWQLRRATAADLDGIMVIESTVFGSDAWSTELMRGELDGAHTYYLVAFPPGQPEVIEGYAGLLAPMGAGEGDIQTIAVAESARRRGLGRTLVLQLVNEARRRGAGEVFLEVRADNPGAQSLYDSLGFVQIAVRPGYYQPDNVDAHVMKLRVPTTETRPA
ncbi:MAG: ribosomal protein S18-alanine N-acetyltransferase [Rhodoglobus sp.]